MEAEDKIKLIRSRRADYNHKKKQAEKFLRIYKALSPQERFRRGDTLLKKAEKWGLKAQEAFIVYLDKVKEKIGL